MTGVLLLQSGCQSGPFSHCGDGSSLFSPCGFFGRVSSRVFNRSNGGCCGSEVVSGVPVGTATPAIVDPAATVPPASPLPSGTIKSYPGTVDTPTDLDAIPPAGTIKAKPSGGSGQATNGGLKPGYQTRGPDSGARIARRRADDSFGSTMSTPVPTSRSAQARSRSAAAASAGPDEQNPLDNLPPLGLPGEVTGSGSSTSSPPAPPARSPAAASASKPDARPDSSAPASDELDLTSITIPAPDPAASASIGPGLARFVAVDLKLAGGSAPSAAGLDWLVEKGYRTVLDLRQSSEVPATFIADVTNRGLRYVALPIGVKSIDRDHVRRFNFEVAAGEARPLFFFDSDGTRAGALWYIRRISADRVDQQVARREAEELGLSDQAYWAAITKFVSTLGPGQTTSSSLGESRTSSAVPAAAATNDAGDQAAPGAKAPATTTGTSSVQPPKAAAATAPVSPSATPTTGLVQPSSGASDSSQSAPTTAGDPLVLRPFAALVITGLSLPLAYWSRTVIPTMLVKSRASLSATALRPKSLPGESGA
jgi:protein tyrosine phosphatase (PTP) superfamily phosphohydrolase (DUF442 family)